MVGDIGAGDQKYERHNGHEDQQGRAELVADATCASGAGNQGEAPVLEIAGELSRISPRPLADALMVNDIHLSGRLRCGYLSSEAGEYAQPEAGRFLQPGRVGQ